VRVLRFGVCRALAELTLARRTVALAAAGLLTLVAATPAPKVPLPTVPLHSAYIVDTNKMGQVTRVTQEQLSKDKLFNLQTYGNALQAYIRTTDGHSVSGKFRLTYDYDPKTTDIRREVALVQTGGVNPNAEGAVNRMMDLSKKHPPAHGPSASSSTAPQIAPKAQPSVDSERLPDLPQIMHSPTP
jgi:hypothetical protein